MLPREVPRVKPVGRVSNVSDATGGVEAEGMQRPLLVGEKGPHNVLRSTIKTKYKEDINISRMNHWAGAGVTLG